MKEEYKFKLYQLAIVLLYCLLMSLVVLVTSKSSNGQIIPDTTNKPLTFMLIGQKQKIKVCKFWKLPSLTLYCTGDYSLCWQGIPPGEYVVSCGKSLFTVNKLK